MTGWRWRGWVALQGVALAFVILPLTPLIDVVNSDWPAFATGARILVSDPAHLYDVDLQRQVQLEVTGGRTLITLGIDGILPFVAPAWVAFFAVPFELLGTNAGGRLWILFGLGCLALGLILAVRPRAPAASLPAFATVPTALLLLNAQLDGLVALGIGGAISLWARPYIGGLCLGLTLLKPQLALPLGVALLAARQWRALAGWATAGLALWGAAAVLDPLWVLKWLPALNGPVGPGSREVDLPHIGTMFNEGGRTWAVATLTLAGILAIVLLARTRRDHFRPAAAILVAGGVLAAPHALPTDLVLVAVALAIWGEAKWYDWLLLSVGAAIAAVTPVPIPTVAGVLTIGWVCLRAAGLVRPTSWRREQAPLSAG